MDFVCPKCRNAMNIVEKQFFECKEHGIYNLENGIPIFFDVYLNEDSLYFQKHWKQLNIEEYAKPKVDTANFFLEYISENLKSQVKILDAGCGDGVHLKCLSKKNKNCKLYGVDISKTGLYKTKINTEQAILSCASVEELPFKDEFFDIVFSCGVLAYTNEPQKAFKEICRVLKKDGLLGVHFFQRPKKFSGFLLKTTRKLATFYKGKFANIIANIIVPFLYILPTSSKLNLSNSSWKECKEVILMNIIPKKIWYPEEDEILSLFKNNNIQIKYISEKNKIIIWGIKQ